MAMEYEPRQVAVGPEDPAVVVATLRRNLDTLQVLAGERSAMEEAVKEEKRKDNVLPKLMATPPQVTKTTVSIYVRIDPPPPGYRPQDDLLSVLAIMRFRQMPNNGTPLRSLPA